MADTIRIEINDGPVIDVLNELIRRGKNMSPVYKAIGESIVESTKVRFSQQHAPDGTPWAQNSDVTLLRYMGEHKSNYTKSGRLSSKGMQRLGSKNVLEGITKLLRDNIHYKVNPDGVEIGSPMVYAAMQQFGGSKSKFPNLWGDIPARPFLGMSEHDEQDIIGLVRGYFSDL